MIALMPNYAPPALVFQSGEGCWLTDTQNRRYLDATAGIAVCSLGHASPVLQAALQQQAAALWHVSNLFSTPSTLALAKALADCSTLSEAKVYLCNSGAEANEAAIKLARKWGRLQKGVEQPEIIVFRNAFHGRTLGALSATPKPAYQAPFAPLLSGFVVADYNDLASVEAVLTPNTVAILVEPLQGEGGLEVATPAFLQGLRQLCDANRVLLMLDEVQCGIARCGSLFAFQQVDGFQPDVLSLAKGLGGGFPIGATVARGEVAASFQPGDHGSTFGGNPMAAAVAKAVLEVVAPPDFLASVQARASQLEAGLLGLKAQYPQVFLAHRGRGLLQGLTVAKDALLVGDLLKTAREEQALLLMSAGDNVLRLAPPLIISEAEVAELLHRLGLAVASALGKKG